MSEILFKYRSWKEDFHKRVLTERKIFFTSPRHINDPFDCKIPINFYDMPIEVAKRRIRRYVRSQSHLTRIEKAFEYNSLLHDFEKDKNDPDLREQQRERSLSHMEKDFGIFSTSEIADDILMWSHYADKHRGYCVGLNLDLLMSAVREWCRSRGVSFNIFPVIYQSQYQELVFGTEPEDIIVLNKALSTKAEQWQYEKEHRLILNGATDVEIVLPVGVIREVIIGANTSDQDRGEITDAIKVTDSEIKVYKARLHPNDYALKIDNL